jgi:hypothetical protein
MGSLIALRPSAATPGPGNGNPAARVEPARYAVRHDGRARYVIVRLVEIYGTTYGVEVAVLGRSRWQGTITNRVEARALARAMGTVEPGLWRRDYTAPSVEPVKPESDR